MPQRPFGAGRFVVDPTRTTLSVSLPREPLRTPFSPSPSVRPQTRIQGYARAGVAQQLCRSARLNLRDRDLENTGSRPSPVLSDRSSEARHLITLAALELRYNLKLKTFYVLTLFFLYLRYRRGLVTHLERTFGDMSARGETHARSNVHAGTGGAHHLLRGLPGPIQRASLLGRPIRSLEIWTCR